jgi:hypothetical protein
MRSISSARKLRQSTPPIRIADRNAADDQLYVLHFSSAEESGGYRVGKIR